LDWNEVESAYPLITDEQKSKLHSTFKKKNITINNFPDAPDDLGDISSPTKKRTPGEDILAIAASTRPLTVTRENEIREKFLKGNLKDYQRNMLNEEIITANYRLVIANAHYYKNQGLDFPDLLMEGVAGLAKSLEKFDWNKKSENNEYLKFSTYATWWIRQSIAKAIGEHASLIRIPLAAAIIKKDIMQIAKAKTELLGRALSVNEIIEAALKTYPKYDKKKIITLIKMQADPTSLDREIKEDGKNTFDNFVTEESNSSEEDIIREEKRQMEEDAIDKALSNEADRELVRMKFGYGKYKAPLSIEEICAIRKWSPETYRSEFSRVQRKLTKYVYDVGLDKKR